MRSIIILFFSLNCFVVFAQKEANIWYFGQNAGLDFNSGSPVPLEDGQINTIEGCASIADENGDLLFYTDGINVWNASHIITPNGSGLLGNISSSQSAVIVQKPLNDSIYYIFTVAAFGESDGLRYSEFNINLDGGKGDITEVKNVPMTTPVCEKVTAVRHSNGKYIWVLTHGFNSDEWFSFLVDENEVNVSPVITNTGMEINDVDFALGYMKTSLDGKKVAAVHYFSFIVELMDYNPSTGEYTNLVTLTLPQLGFGAYGLEFSPNGDLLYVGLSGTNQFSQFDLTQVDIQSTEVVFNLPDVEFLGALQLAPDQRIYLSQLGQQNLSVIAQPNELGLMCEPLANEVNLGSGFCLGGLPAIFPEFIQHIDFSFSETCFGDSTCFELSLAQESDSILWHFDDPDAGPDNFSNDQDPCHLFTQPGEYNVVLIVASDGVFDTLVRLVQIDSAAHSELTGPDIGCPGDLVTLEIISDGQVENYNWNTGDTTSSLSLILDSIFNFNVTVTSCNEQQVLQWSIDTSFCCQEAIAHYSLDDCDASEGETAVYAEFNAVQLCDLACSEVSSSIVYRNPANSNRHSCTPGVSDAAMCVGSLDECEYIPGNEKSIVFEITVNPEEGAVVRINGLQFYEKAPEMFDWINGNSGVNNYPTLYGVRILKNGDELFSSSNLETTTDWTLEEFSFDDLVALEECTYTFELLGYCLVGNGADVSAWDIDEISVFASCEDDDNFLGDIGGSIATSQQIALSDIELILLDLQTEELENKHTDENGAYLFEKVDFNSDYSVIPESKSDYLNGLSTYDLVQIQKHLLGVKRFDTAYEMIAADANGSETVSALDIVTLRMLLLGNSEILENVNSWRFVENSADVSVENAFEFEEKIDIMSFGATEKSYDFIAVKVGDLNGSAAVSHERELGERSNSSVQMFYRLLNEDGESRIELSVPNDITIEGLQIDLNFSENSVTKMESEFIKFTREDYRVDQERLRVVKVTQEPVELLKGQVVATIHLRNSVKHIQVQSISGANSLKNELYEANGYIKQLEIVKQEPTFEISEILIRPNPFSELTNISFALSEDSDVQLTIQNAEGIEVFRRQIDGIYGHQEFQIFSNEISTEPGIFYIIISSDSDQQIGKMVHLK